MWWCVCSRSQKMIIKWIKIYENIKRTVISLALRAGTGIKTTQNVRLHLPIMGLVSKVMPCMSWMISNFILKYFRKWVECRRQSAEIILIFANCIFYVFYVYADAHTYMFATISVCMRVCVCALICSYAPKGT